MPYRVNYYVFVASMRKDMGFRAIEQKKNTLINTGLLNIIHYPRLQEGLGL